MSWPSEPSALYEVVRAAQEAEIAKHRCVTCNCTAYEHRDHQHQPYPTCPFGDCDEFTAPE